MESTSLQDFSTTTWSRFHELDVVQIGDNYYMRQAGTEKEMGILDIVTAELLKSLCQRPQITHTAVLDASALPKLPKKNIPQHVVIDISINLSGPIHMIDDVGAALTKASGFLQHPYFLPAATPYVNPHYFYPGGMRTDLTHLIGPPMEETEDSDLAQGLGDVLDSLADSEWSSSLELTLSSLEGNITTALKSPLTGGIVADVMGLGKSLTMLSAVVCSMQSAEEFSHLDMGIPTTRATLIVATSPQVMGVWKSEIERHIKPGTLRLCIFHGSGRAKTPEDMVDNDVVLTTYHTLVADWKSHRLLQKPMWFRVVLDEELTFIAHWIRNTTSQQFKAARDLKAQRRWCLSGTPIQNTLDDLRSLLDFLHFEPFSEPGFFRKHIIEPLHVNSLDPFRNLRLLLRITCFRRTAELLCLPPHETTEVDVSLTGMETQLYEGILDRCKEEFEEISYGKSSKKRYTVLFAATMRLRRLCNHGTFKEPQTLPGSVTPKRKGKAASRKKLAKSTMS
ncbi:hypothetical protein PG991_000575 [Apiospora marii]|uniref:Helicase ATP-binding domain-containing protein n=1 Tax=Apiospora marii TaxID=335849 RepID=A0ABR1SSD1_9PEZI